MKRAQKKRLAGQGEPCQEHSKNQLSSADSTRIPAQFPLQRSPRPLRTFKAEHGDFCRYVMAPRKRDRRLTTGELDARRREAAWRTVCAALRNQSVGSVLAFAPCMAKTWERFRMLPNCPPAFAFDELDAVRMVLDAAGCRR